MEEYQNKIRIYYRSMTAKDNVYTFLVPRKSLSCDMTKLYLSNYRLGKCEWNCHLCYGDCLDFSLSPAFLNFDNKLDVYRSASGKLYRACRG